MTCMTIIFYISMLSHKMAAHPNFSQSIDSSGGICLTSTRILNQNNCQYLCMKCFSCITIDSDKYKLSITHYFINDPYYTRRYKCVACNNDLVQSRPFNDCPQCSRKYAELLSKIPKDEIDLSSVTFRLNIFTDTIEGIVPIDL